MMNNCILVGGVRRFSSKKSDSDKSSSISTQDLELLVDSLKNEQHRSSTRSNYYSIWKIFNKFFLRLDIKPLNWEDRITLFVAHLIKEGKQSSTICSYLSAIRAVLKKEGIHLNEDMYLLTALTRACKLKNDRIMQRQPIRKTMLFSLIDALKDVLDGQPYLFSMYAALFLTTYSGLFRIGEVTQSPHVIKACDVQQGKNKKKLKFTLWTSKMHNRGNRPQIVKIKQESLKSKNRKSSHHWCPFREVQTYLRLRPDCESSDEQFFIFRDGSPVMPHHFRDMLNVCLQKAGYDSELFSIHSMRGGCAVDLLNHGISVETIKKLGRWKSNAVFAYLRIW